MTGHGADTCIFESLRDNLLSCSHDLGGSSDLQSADWGSEAIEQFCQATLGDQPASVEDSDVCADLLDIAKHVRGEENGGVIAQVADEGEDIGSAQRVEGGGGFIEDD